MYLMWDTNAAKISLLNIISLRRYFHLLGTADGDWTRSYSYIRILSCVKPESFIRPVYLIPCSISFVVLICKFTEVKR